MFQNNEQNKTPGEQLSEDEILEKELRVIIVKMIQDLKKRMEAQTKKI